MRVADLFVFVGRRVRLVSEISSEHGTRRLRNDAQRPGRLHKAPWSTHPSRREQRVFGQPVRVTARAAQGRMSLPDGWQLCIPDLSVNRVCWPTAVGHFQSSTRPGNRCSQ